MYIQMRASIPRPTNQVTPFNHGYYEYERCSAMLPISDPCQFAVNLQNKTL